MNNTIDYASDPKSRLSGMAVMSIVVALIGIPFLPAWMFESAIYELGRTMPGSGDLIAIVAILLWTGACVAFIVVAWRRIVTSNGRLRGRRLVYTAMAIESVWILLAVFVIALFWDADLH